MLQPLGSRPHNQVALWFEVSRIGELYQLYKSKQLQASKAALTSDVTGTTEIHFYEDLYGSSTEMQNLFFNSYIHVLKFWSRVDKECQRCCKSRPC